MYKLSQFHLKAIGCEVLFYDLQGISLQIEFWGMCVKTVHAVLFSA